MSDTRRSNLAREFGEHAKVVFIPDKGIKIKCRICWQDGKEHPTHIGTIPEIRAWWRRHAASDQHVAQEQTGAIPRHIMRHLAQRDRTEYVMETCAAAGHSIEIHVKGDWPWWWKCSCGKGGEAGRFDRQLIRAASTEHAEEVFALAQD